MTLFIKFIGQHFLVRVLHEVRLRAEIVASGFENLASLEVLDKNLALVGAPCRQNHVLLKIYVLVNGVIEPAQHDGTTLRAGEIRELVSDTLILDEPLIVERIQRHILELILDKGMHQELID